MPLFQSATPPVWQFFKKLNIALSCGPTILLLRIYLKELKAGSQTDICIPIFIVVLFTRAKKWKRPKCPSVNE